MGFFLGLLIGVGWEIWVVVVVLVFVGWLVILLKVLFFLLVVVILVIWGICWCCIEGVGISIIYGFEGVVEKGVNNLLYLELYLG